MAIKINGQDLLKRFINGQEIVRVYKNGGQIRPETVPPVFDDYLCFTAQQSNSTVALNRIGSPTAVSLEISYDKSTWMDYNIGGVIALSNVGDKVYFRNKSSVATGFSLNGTSLYKFAIQGIVGASGEVNSLLSKNGTDTLVSGYCFYELFSGTPITTPPKLSATTLTASCYSGMFRGCPLLTTPPSLPATVLPQTCYDRMFWICPSLNTLPLIPATTFGKYCCDNMFFYDTLIKLSETQTGEYQTPYRIPVSGTGTVDGDSLIGMFGETGGTFKGTPSINTTYYTSNQVI